MKTLTEYTDQEKIQMFNVMYEDAKIEYERSLAGNFPDFELYYESTIGYILSMIQEDWNKLSQNNT